MPYYLVEYQLSPRESFTGHGGYVTKKGKLLGITSDLKPDYKIVTKEENYDYETEIFPLLYSFSTHVNKDIEWNSDTGEVILMNNSLNFKKTMKKMELKNLMESMLSETNEIVLKIATMIVEGFSNSEINNEKQKYADILAKRKTIKKNYDKVLQLIDNCTSLTQLQNINITEELLREREEDK